MYKQLIFCALFALCKARPGNIGLGLGGHGIAAIAAPVAVAPLSINSGISSQSRVDIRTPVVAVPNLRAVPVAVAAQPIGVSSVGIGGGYGGIGGGYGGIGGGYGGIGVGVAGIGGGYGGVGLGGIGVGIGGVGNGVGLGYGH